ncbi:hypothetical protein [Bacillus sp. V33-4]|uniref:hypothetical protein n=1 Tax=Bacillus sp. V33-4 TaxID=2054169 RepID=UPI000C78D5A8|nr:hypothetical protein [Bacillus sp. V33-4]PLR85755.1 hypothetical protein CVD23_07920 [Bacillus sp. V33-4]
MTEEQTLINIFAFNGGFVSNGELYLSIQKINDFVTECNKLEVAIIGVEFFSITKDGKILPLSSPIAIDLSDILNEHDNWAKTYTKCNGKVLEIFEQENLDNCCYSSFVITNQLKR